MSIDKKTAIQQLGTNSNVSNQYSLVKKLSGPKINKTVKMVIPAGKNLTELISREKLPQAIFTWLRRVRHFKDVTISFIDDISNRDYHQTTVVDFNTNNKLPEWELQGKKWLAERTAEVLAMENILAVKIDKQGIHAILDMKQSFNSESENWEPHLLFTPHKPTGF